MTTHSRPLSTLNATDIVNVIALTIAIVQPRRVVSAVLVSITPSIECTTMDAQCIFDDICLDYKSFKTNFILISNQTQTNIKTGIGEYN